MRKWFWPLARYFLYAIFAAGVLDQALASRAETRRLLRERYGYRSPDEESSESRVQSPEFSLRAAHHNSEH